MTIDKAPAVVRFHRHGGQIDIEVKDADGALLEHSCVANMNDKRTGGSREIDAGNQLAERIVRALNDDEEDDDGTD